MFVAKGKAFLFRQVKIRETDRTSGQLKCSQFTYRVEENYYDKFSELLLLPDQ